MMSKDEFCRQVRLCEKAMYSLAFSIVRNDADAAEVLSESTLLAWKNLKNLKRQTAFKSWILRIVHNCAVDLVRRDCRHIYVADLPENAAVHDDEERDVRIALRQAVEKLRQPYRTVVQLFYYEDMSIADITHITGAGTAQVKKQLFRAREMLRESFKEV